MPDWPPTITVPSGTSGLSPGTRFRPLGGALPSVARERLEVLEALDQRPRQPVLDHPGAAGADDEPTAVAEIGIEIAIVGNLDLGRSAEPLDIDGAQARRRRFRRGQQQQREQPR
ncbi:MAG TPA: hypothetical protein VEA60_02830 [Allosphingosinicella sp.]|nr:hypothetical protein [Allosphingosinicella sp.]